MPRLYGRKGFTRTNPVRDLLDAFEQPADDSNRVRFERMPAAAAARLLARLPEAQTRDRASQDAPTFGELVVLAALIDGVLFDGFRVAPDQLDERITVDRVTIPSGVLNHEAVRALVAELSDPSVLAIGPDGSAYASWQ